MSSKSYNTHFGTAVSNRLAAGQLTQATVAASAGTTVSYLNQTMTGRKRPSPQWADLIADVLNMNSQERANLHAAAAMDHGFKLDLTK